MGPIQRYPFGFLETLSIKGVAAPANLSETIVPIVNTLQFYAGSQRVTIGASNAALPRGNTVSAIVTTGWTLLTSASIQLTKSATGTEYGFSLFASGPNITVCLAERYVPAVPAGATGVLRAIFVPSEPLALPPSTNLFGSYDAGNDAAANVFVSFSIARE